MVEALSPKTVAELQLIIKLVSFSTPAAELVSDGAPFLRSNFAAI